MFGFNSLTPFNRKQSFLDSFLNEPLYPFIYGNDLKTDIKETDDAYSVVVEIPGASKEDIAINYDQNDILSVTVSKCEEKNEENAGYIHRERREGTSRREYYLPCAESKGITAKYANGILTVFLPKNKDAAGGQRISIE
ncbi:MAG: Hsp20/alpha crystallin family protein [Clostridia bacterium]|nr:Hsp20/alpha crystallin family protein [Clostridia bacterium]